MLMLRVDIPGQRLDVLVNDQVIDMYPVSTAANGVGQQMNSFCTPSGRHIIRAKIGAGEPVNTIFLGRRPTGRIYQTGMSALYLGRDWILTRILWLSGCEPGFNRLGRVDSMRRYIYIHGTPDEIPLGEPGSRGCIRMHNKNLLRLFDQVVIGTPVNICA